MVTVRSLHEEVLNREAKEGRQLKKMQEAYQMDCLLHPENEKGRSETIRTCDVENIEVSRDVAFVLREY